MYNKKKMILITGMLFGVFLMIPLTRLSATDVVWEDFNDDDLAGWALTTYYTTDRVNVPLVKGEVTIVNENKRIVLPAIYNGTHRVHTQADINSTQVYGHWSFDVDTTAGCHGFFLFIYRDVTPETDLEEEEFTNQKPNGFEGYGLGVSTYTDLMLGRFDANFTNAGENKTPSEDFVSKSVSLGITPFDVFHIDITRAPPDGNMTVYLNSIPKINLIDNTYTISDSVSLFNFGDTVYYDNIRVDENYIWPRSGSTTTPTTTTEETTPTTKASPSWSPLAVLTSVTALLIFRKRIKLDKLE